MTVLAFWFAQILGAHACQVPVFRYALERWAPAEYLVSVAPGENGLTAEEQTAADLLRTAPLGPENPVNLKLQIEDPIAGATGPAQILVHYPPQRGGARKEPIWQAPLTVENVRRLLDSPARRELRRRLLAGESAIWLLVESGDVARDDRAASALSGALMAAQSSLRLPEGVVAPGETPQPPGAAKPTDPAELLRLKIPLKIAFSVLRFGRNDPEEAALLAMLMHLEDDLGGLAQEPMAFPVFGRGRVLEPLIGAGIGEDNVLEHSGYLCGACSCEVKDQNPGNDLLLAANWEPVDTTPKLETVRISAGGDAPAAPRTSYFAAGSSVILGGLAVWMLRRGSSTAGR